MEFLVRCANPEKRAEAADNLVSRALAGAAEALGFTPEYQLLGLVNKPMISSGCRPNFALSVYFEGADTQAVRNAMLDGVFLNFSSPTGTSAAVGRVDTISSN